MNLTARPSNPEIFLRENSISIVCLNETKPSARTDFKLSGYTLATRKDCSSMHGGGCAILVKDYIDCREVELPEDDICAITMYLNKKLVCIRQQLLRFCSRYPTSTGQITSTPIHIPMLYHSRGIQCTSYQMVRPNKRGNEIAQICKDHILTILNTPNIYTAHNQNQSRRSTTIDLAIMTENITTRDFTIKRRVSRK